MTCSSPTGPIERVLVRRRRRAFARNNALEEPALSYGAVDEHTRFNLLSARAVANRFGRDNRYR